MFDFGYEHLGTKFGLGRAREKVFLTFYIDIYVLPTLPMMGGVVGETSGVFIYLRRRRDHVHVSGGDLVIRIAENVYVWIPIPTL